jgi:hypothetical protein
MSNCFTIIFSPFDINFKASDTRMSFIINCLLLNLVLFCMKILVIFFFLPYQQPFIFSMNLFPSSIFDNSPYQRFSPAIMIFFFYCREITPSFFLRCSKDSLVRGLVNIVSIFSFELTYSNLTFLSLTFSLNK